MSRRRPLVLMYHAFGVAEQGTDPHHLHVTAEDLDRQLALLTRWYRPLTLPAYLAGLRSRRWPARSVLVTIDDGFASTLELAAPILARRGVPSVLFVPPARLGGTSGWMDDMPGERMLTADELVALTADHPVEVGVHGWDHAELVDLSADELDRQVVDARDHLAELLGRRPATFAYPFGTFDAATHAAVRDAGYDAAFSVDDPGPGDEFALVRTHVGSRDALPTFATKLVPGYGPVWRRTADHRVLRRSVAWVARVRNSS